MLPKLPTDVYVLQIVLTAAYLGFMLLIGWWADKATKKNADSFIVGGRKFSTWIVVFTLFATWWGGGTAMGSSGAAFREGLGGVIPDPFAAGVTLIVAGLFYMSTLRKMKLRSMGAAYSRYGDAGVNIASGIYIYVYILYLAVQLLAIGLVFHVILGVDKYITTIVGTLILILYTYLGGIVAVAWTDFIQGIMIILGLVVILPIAIDKAGGWQVVVQNAGPDWFRSFLPGHNGNSVQNYIIWIYAWLGMGLGSLVEPSLLQRAFIAKSSKVARNSSYIAGGMYLTLGWIPLLLGMVGISLAKQGVIPMDILANDAETVVPLIARALLHPLPLALFTGSLLAGVMSTGDSVLFSEAVIFSNNLWPSFKKKFLKKKVTEKEIYKVTKISIVVLGLLSLGIALIAESLYDLMIYSYSLMFAMLFFPLTFALFWKKANTPGAISGMLGGLVVIVTGMIVNKTIIPEPEWAWVMGAVLASSVLTIGVSLLTQKKKAPMPLMSEDGEIVKWPELATPEMHLHNYTDEDTVETYTIEQEGN